MLPAQNAVSPVIEHEGIGLIVTFTEAVLVYPLVVVPVTEYVPAAVTVIEAVVAPLLHKYVAAPVAVSVVDPPVQNARGPEIFTVGLGFTVTFTEAVFIHPLAAVPVTEYVPAAVTVIEAVVDPLL